MANPLFASLLKLKSSAMRLLLGEERREAYSTEKQKEIIEGFPEPRDLLDRSYFQYICQKRRYASFSYRIVCELANMAALFPLVYFAFFKRSSPLSKDNIAKKSEAVFLGASHISDRIPDSLWDRYCSIAIGIEHGMSVTKTERLLIRRIWARYPLSFLFTLKCAMKIAAYCDIIDRTDAKALIVTSEDSYTSSILTQYCRERSVKHINIAHGEMLYGLSRTFFCFDECFVWDEYYEQLCLRMGAESSQFEVEIPEGLLYRDNECNAVGVTYYFQNQTKDQMVLVKEALEKLGKPYRVRPHPIYTDIGNLHSVFCEEEIEDFNSVSIEQSIMGSEMLIAKHSTVLFQGYINGKKTVIDDVSNPSAILQMRDSGYIMLNKCECTLLSDVLANCA